MGRKRNKPSQAGKEEEAGRGKEAWNGGAQDPLKLLVAVSNGRSRVATAYGATVRLWDASSAKGSALCCRGEELLPSAVRVLAFSPTGEFLLTASDDKWVRLWSAGEAGWTCSARTLLPKKCSAAAFTPCSKWALLADKFGDVYAVDMQANGESRDEQQEEGGSSSASEGVTLKPWLQFGHFCSILTCLDVSPDGRRVLSGDRDSKLRVTWMAEDPRDNNGAFEIAAFCLGHTRFVTGGAFCGDELLVSCSGDGSVALWDTEGSLLSRCQLGGDRESGREDAEEEVEEGCDEEGAEGGEEGDDEGAPKSQCTGVVTLAVMAGEGLVAAAVEGVSEVFLLRVGPESRSISLEDRVELAEGLLPTSLQFDTLGSLWIAGSMTMGSKAGELDLRVMIPQAGDGARPKYRLALRGEAPCGDEMLAALSGPAGGATTGAFTQLSGQLRKREISEEERETRKVQRADKKHNTGNK